MQQYQRAAARKPNSNSQQGIVNEGLNEAFPVLLCALDPPVHKESNLSWETCSFTKIVYVKFNTLNVAQTFNNKLIPALMTTPIVMPIEAGVIRGCMV